MYPEQEQIDDFAAWVADLDTQQQSLIENMPETLDLFPKFCDNWTLKDTWSIIQDQL